MLKNALICSAVATLSYPFFFADDPLTPDSLNNMIKGLGYETKNINTDAKPKYEFTCKTQKFNIPISGEVSPSGNYVWLTINLGAVSKDTSKHLPLLSANADIQPSFFYVTKKDSLMLASPIDNRGISAAVLKRVVEKMIKDVDNTATLWQ